jgi:hypothetical protein
VSMSYTRNETQMNGKFWVTQWDVKTQSTSSILVATPEGLWNAVKSLAEENPDDHIVIVPAD